MTIIQITPPALLRATIDQRIKLARMGNAETFQKIVVGTAYELPDDYLSIVLTYASGYLIYCGMDGEGNISS